MRIYSVIMVLFAPLILAGCDSPSMAFQGIAPVEATVDGTRFLVRYTPYDAEAKRASFEPFPRRSLVVPKAVIAMERTSGCKVVRKSIRGDEILIAADLTCKGVTPPPVRSHPPRFDCTAFEVGRVRGSFDLEVDCLVVD